MEKNNPEISSDRLDVEKQRLGNLTEKELLVELCMKIHMLHLDLLRLATIKDMDLVDM